MKCKKEKCGADLSPLEIRLWKDKCHSCAAKAYKFVISRLSTENEELNKKVRDLENELLAKVS
jgi:hypothetical protein